MAKDCDGILLIDKREDETSIAVVERVRKALKVRKIGHGGALDPFASGLLLILLGKGTKLFPFLLEYPKEYLFTIRLGIETDTLDCKGSIVDKRPVPSINKDDIEKVLDYMKGEQVQIPPLFSAIKIKGERAYRLARKGRQFELRERHISIYDLKLVRWDSPTLSLWVRCSSGTYIRALGRDMAKRLGSIGHLISLRRISIGPFNVQHAIDSFDIERMERSNLRERIIPLRRSLPHLEEIKISQDLAEKIRSGNQTALNRISLKAQRDGKVKLISNDRLIGIIRAIPASEGITYRILRIF